MVDRNIIRLKPTVTDSNIINLTPPPLEYFQQLETMQDQSNTVTSNKISWAGVANICTATLGCGIVSLPNAFQKCGLLGGILLVSLAAYSSYWSIALLSEALDAVGRDQRINRGTHTFSSFESTTEKICGPGAAAIVKIAIISMSWGACIAYLVAVGDMLDDAIVKTFDTNLTRESVMVIFWAVFMLPLSLLGKMEYLKVSSSFGVMFVLFFVLVTIYKSFEGLAEEGFSDSWGGVGVRMWPESFEEFIKACPIVMFAFTCQHIVPRIYHELDDDVRSPAYMRKVILRSVSLSSTVYMLMGVFAYLKFGEVTNEDVLKNFCVQNGRDALIIASFIFMALKLCVAVPLNVFPCRDSIYYIITHSGKHDSDRSVEKEIEGDKTEPLLDAVETAAETLSESQGSSPSSDANSGSMSFAWHTFLTLAISLSSLFVALSVPDISVVLGLMGGTSTALLTYIMPGVFIIRLGLAEEEALKKHVAWGFVILGTFFGIFSTIYTIIGMINPSEEEEICQTR